MRKEILNICFNLYLVIALGKCAKPSSVLLRSIYNLLRSREGMQKGEDRVHDMKHSHIILPEENQNCCRLQIFFKTNVLKNFAIFAGKQLRWSLFLAKLHAWRPATLLERDSNTCILQWILQNSQEQLFLQNSSVAASER